MVAGFNKKKGGYSSQDTKKGEHFRVSLMPMPVAMDSLLQTELNDIPQARLYHFSRPFFMIF